MIPSAGWASQRTSLARFHERRMKARRGGHQLVVLDAPHTTGTSTVTFVSHALLQRILSLEHLEGDTEARKAKVQPLLGLIEPFALQPEGAEAKEGEPDAESDGGSDDDEEGCSAEDGDSDSETDSMSDESGSDEEYGGSSRAAAAAGRPSASGQRDAAFSDLVRVPTGIVWRGIAVDAYQHKGQVSGLRSQRRLRSAAAALHVEAVTAEYEQAAQLPCACPRSLILRSLTLCCMVVGCFCLLPADVEHASHLSRAGTQRHAPERLSDTSGYCAFRQDDRGWTATGRSCRRWSGQLQHSRERRARPGAHAPRALHRQLRQLAHASARSPMAGQTRWQPGQRRPEGAQRDARRCRARELPQSARVRSVRRGCPSCAAPPRSCEFAHASDRWWRRELSAWARVTALGRLNSHSTLTFSFSLSSCPNTFPLYRETFILVFISLHPSFVPLVLLVATSHSNSTRLRRALCHSAIAPSVCRFPW